MGMQSIKIKPGYLARLSPDEYTSSRAIKKATKGDVIGARARKRIIKGM